MTAGDQHRRVAELLGAFVLHAVDADEVEVVERHLEECHRCQAEVDELREVAASIGSSPEPPSGTLWDRIAAQLGSPPAAEGTPAPALDRAALEGMSRARVRDDTVVLPGPDRVGSARRGVRRSGGGHPGRRRGWAVAGVGAAAACAALAAVFGVSWSNANDRVGELRTELAQQAPRAAVQSALGSPGRRIVDLHSIAGAQLAQIVVQRDGAGFVVSSSMPALPADETYQLWAQIGDQPISLGLLGPKPRLGDAFSLGTSVESAHKLMVTVEPAGGVVAPDRAPIASGAVG